MKIAILGGIGVEASHYAYGEIIRRIQKKGMIRNNTDYPQIILNSINAPELHLEEHDNAFVLSHYIQGVRELAMHQPDFIVMICNTIHLFRDDIIRATGYENILSIRDIVEGELRKNEIRKVCVLGTGLTASRGLYTYDNFEKIEPSAHQQDILVDVIHRFNTGELSQTAAQSMLLPIIEEKQQSDVTFLLACTEISEVLLGVDIPILDTLELLIDTVVDRFLSRYNILMEAVA